MSYGKNGHLEWGAGPMVPSKNEHGLFGEGWISHCIESGEKHVDNVFI